MKKLFPTLAILLALLTVGSSCDRYNPANEKRYELKGKVVSVEADKQQVTIDHEEIKDFMPAMAMPFTLRDKETLNFMSPGDDISAILVVNGDESWLESPVVTRRSEGPPTPTGVLPAKAGDEVPNFKLVNQDGKSINLHSYRGKALLVTFIYTRCPLPEYCDLMSTNFAAIEKKLAERKDAYAKTHLLSISIDPEYDTPKVLRSYGSAHTERYHAEKFDHWEFATGTKEQIKEVAQFFGLAYQQASDQIVHNLVTAIIGPDGKVVKVYADNKWKSEEVAAELERSALAQR